MKDTLSLRWLFDYKNYDRRRSLVTFEIYFIFEIIHIFIVKVPIQVRASYINESPRAY